MRDLLELRNEIDDIDNKIVELYEKRMHISTEVAEYKIQTGKKVFDKEREDSKLNTLESKASTSFTKRGIRELFEHIMSMSRKKQYQLLADNGLTSDENFEQVEKLDFTNAKIVFQGVEGAYSQQATKEYFGENCDCYNVETWKDAMEAIKNNEADYAVLPIENSSAGIVSENYDLLVEYNNYIVAEQIIKIDHCLLALKGAELEDIKTVYSHPQALMQCSKYLDSHREWDRLSVKNTAFSAQKIKEDGLCNQAAIASTITADIYGLQILDSAIQNNKNNSTRFIIVTNKKMYDKNATKMSICFEIPHKSGSLYNILSHFIFNNVNMTNIQSRPIPGRNWEYRFFVDFEGNFTDTGVVNALRGLKEETISLKILGTY
ncbi:MAG: prephenate dehydratase [Agathobacter sp.]|nr:prephenate dehydratase [Agathobacter sp.]